MTVRTILAAVSLLLVAVAATRLVAPMLVVNGKASEGGVLVSDGKTYVSLDALAKGGAQVTSTGDKVTVNFLPLAGREQVDAVEGNLEYWLQNDVWRIRVESVAEGSNPFGRGPGFTAKVEFRNLGKRAISPFASGLDKIQVIDDKNQAFDFSQATFKQFFKDIAPGGSAVETIGFGDQQGALVSAGKPEKLMIFFRSSGGKKAKDFRVFLNPQ
jgi:hypothetical protein